MKFRMIKKILSKVFGFMKRRRGAHTTSTASSRSY